MAVDQLSNSISEVQSLALTLTALSTLVGMNLIYSSSASIQRKLKLNKPRKPRLYVLL